MPIEIKMPALSPTMEEGTLARWLVKEGDKVSSGDLIAEIETDKATMEFEAVDEGTIARIAIPEGTDSVKVGTVIAILAEEGEDVSAAETAGTKSTEPKAQDRPTPKPEPEVAKAAAPAAEPAPAAALPAASSKDEGKRVKASPLARRLAESQGLDLSQIQGSGPGGRVVKADLADGKALAQATEAPVAKAQTAASADSEIPHEIIKLSNMRKVIARRLTESKQATPHIYLTVDCNLDALLKLRTELNVGLESAGIKLSVNDLLIKALATALVEVPDANVSFAGDTLLKFSRVDISMAVAIPGGLITPIIADAAAKRVSQIAAEAKDLAARAREGKLQPHEFQGGTASISNLGMYGIKQFDAVINPPQAMILAVGAGEKRPYVVNDALSVATVMSATGSFDHRAIDGAVGAELMQAFKRLVERPLTMLA